MTSSSKSSSVPPPQPSQPEKLLAASHIPLIDLAPLLSGKDKQSVATLIDHACRTSGFFAIKSHGIAKEIVTEMLHTSKAFFDLPAHEKQLLSTGQTRDYPYGYSGVMEETLSVGKAMEHNLDKRTEEEDASSDEFFSMTTPASAPLPDLKESFSMGPYNPLSGVIAPIFPPVSDFSKAYMRYYQAMETLSAALTTAFALALKLPERWFDDKVDKHRCCIRSINYPAVKTVLHQLRASPHTDYGTLTILLQDAIGGLQVQHPHQPDVWIDVVPCVTDEEPIFIVNIGDLMQRWTNDTYVSTIHRVIDKSNPHEVH